MVDGQVLDMDELDYTYNGNQLTMVRDYTNNPDGFKEIPSEAVAYTYDGSGNLITDTNKRITKITYNHLNLPVSIDTDQGSIYYVYDAAGNKLKKSVLANSGPNQITEYIDGFQYLNGTLQFFPQPEGYAAYQNNAYLYHYIHKDHLGNNRVVYADGNNNGVIEPTEILEENNYYPFGLKHQGYNDMTGSTASNYKYQYNGKELQDEMGLNLYDFGARNYDAAIGRWMNVDPLAENSRRWTPYNYAYNNPILFVDPDGMQSYVFNGKAAQDFARDLQSQLALNDGVENDCKSCKTKADWDAYYQQAENTAAMMGEDAWGYTNKRLTREMDEQGHSIFYLDGERMDLKQYSNRADAAGNLISDAALIEASVGFLKYINSFFKSSNAAAKGGKELFKFTSTAAKHMDEAGRMIPIQTLDDIIKAPMSVVKDPQGTKALMYYSQMWKNGKLYNVEILYDKGANTIMHFKYTQKSLGSLPAIK